MKQFLRYGLLGLLAFLLFLPLLAPAGLMVDLFGKQMGFSVETIEGSTTAGSAQGVRWRELSIKRLSWNWRPLALLGGWLEFQLDADDPEAKLMGNVAVGWGGRLRFQDFSGHLPMVKLSELARQPKLPLQGIVKFDLQELRLSASGQPQSAEGRVNVMNLRTMLNRPLDLGDFTVQLNPAAPEGIQGMIKDSRSPLTLEGVLDVAPDGRYRFRGTAAARDASSQPFLRQALSLLGPPGSDGRWKLDFSGVLSR
ncbi:MAG: type II secretion system protein N [Phycisphaerales bacterium]|nr:type II secretion system protein N [Phycisphaerales bacterium]